ncbi:hypothetical protein K474DRAFT_1659780 [Panus rudis PR-1116 ss-1]|nr:hypothetical protein K474DRAFT_1659780 [Panus rudis PR-1116 ss-1]
MGVRGGRQTSQRIESRTEISIGRLPNQKVKYDRRSSPPADTQLNTHLVHTMFRLSSQRRAVLRPRAIRLYSTEQQKVPIKLVAELRKLTEVSLSKAREALTATNNDVQAALEWLDKDAAISGAKKAAKLEGREAKQGLVGVSVLSRGTLGGEGPARGGVRGAMVELNCETDFVARNELFGKLLADITHTAAFLTEYKKQQSVPVDVLDPLSIEELQEMPLLSHQATDPLRASTHNVADAIKELVGKVGEKISLRRAVTAVLPAERIPERSAYHLASCAHGGVQASQGRVAALLLVVLRGSTSKVLSELLSNDIVSKDLFQLEDALARQVVGFPTLSFSPPNSDSPSEEDMETALLTQSFMMYPPAQSRPVMLYLQEWAKTHGLVTSEGESALIPWEFAKWTVGENVEDSLIRSNAKEAGKTL